MSQNTTDEAEVMEKDGTEVEAEEIDEQADDSALEEDDSDDLDEKDWKAEALKFKAIAKRKSGQLESASKPKPKPAEPVKKDSSEEPSQVEKLLEQKLMERDLAELDVSDNLRAEIKKYAEFNGVSVNSAVNSPFISFLKNQEAEKAKVEEASISSKRKGQPTANFEDMNPGDFDMSTEDGRKQWEDWRNWLKNSN